MLSTDYVLGFVEGEGCFSIPIGRNIDRKPRKNPGKRLNIKNPFLFQIKPTFRITQVEANMGVLGEIKETLGFGHIYVQNRGATNSSIQNSAHFYTGSLAEAFKVKEYFQKLAFRTSKGKDFALWCQCIELIAQGKHKTKEGILEICRLRDQMNFRPTKGKWSLEEVQRILEEKPIHQVAHFDANQQQLIHNKEGSHFDVGAWLVPGQGNSKKSRPNQRTLD